MLHFHPPNSIHRIRSANRLALIDTPAPVRVPHGASDVKASVVTNVEDRLKYWECLTPEQRARFRRQLAADIAAAVLALSKEAQ